MHVYQYCEGAKGWSEIVVASSDPARDPYTVLLPAWSDKWGLCSCEGYKFRGECRHVKQALLERCRWHEGMQPQSPEQKTSRTCPDCGGKTKLGVVVD